MTIILSTQTVEILVTILVYIIGLLYSSYLYNYFKQVDDFMLFISFFIFEFSPISVPICIIIQIIALTSKIWR
jgi:hypothetical protein